MKIPLTIIKRLCVSCSTMRFGFLSSICWDSLRILWVYDERSESIVQSLTNPENRIPLASPCAPTPALAYLEAPPFSNRRTHAALALPCSHTLLLPPSSQRGEKLSLQVRIGARIQHPERAQIGTRRKRGAMTSPIINTSTSPLPT